MVVARPPAGGITVLVLAGVDDVAFSSSVVVASSDVPSSSDDDRDAVFVWKYRQ
jgi:hypothetical protein